MNKMNRKEAEARVKSLILTIQNTADGFEKEDAMMEILKMFRPFRHSLTSKFTGKGIEFDDICQVIDMKLIEAMYDYDESLDSSAIRHITSKARNGIFNYYKKEMNYFKEDRKTVSIDSASFSISHNGYKKDIDDTDYVMAYYNLGYDFDEDKIIENIMIEQGMEKLTDHQKELINMYYLSDMTQEEIAIELDIHQANVSRATKRGVKKLRESFNPVDEQDDMP